MPAAVREREDTDDLELLRHEALTFLTEMVHKMRSRALKRLVGASRMVGAGGSALSLVLLFPENLTDAPPEVEVTTGQMILFDFGRSR